MKKLLVVLAVLGVAIFGVTYRRHSAKPSAPQAIEQAVAEARARKRSADWPTVRVETGAASLGRHATDETEELAKQGQLGAQAHVDGSASPEKGRAGAP